MKKLLLSALSAVAVALASQAAEPLSIEFTKNSTAYEQTSSYSSTWSSTDGNWEFHALNNNKNGWDFIAGGWKTDATEAYFATKTEAPATISDLVVTIGDRFTAGAVTKATLLVADNADFTSATETDVTSYLPAAKNTDMTIDVNGAAGSYIKVVFSIPKQSANGQAISFSKIVLNYGEGGGDVKKPAGLAWSASTVDVDVDFIEDFVAPTLSNPNNLTVTYSSSNETVGTVNETTGVVALEGEEGSTIITASFAGNNEFRAQEVSYTINVKAKPAAVASVKETIALEPQTEFTVGYALTVGFINNANIFAVDAAGDFIQIYKSNSGLKVGDVIPAGWSGKYILYNNVTPEIEPAGTLPAATAGTFTPKAVAAADVTTALVNHVITIKDVVFDEATPSTKDNFTGKVGDTELSFRNNYTKPGVEAGTYNVTVVVTIYQDTVSLYIIEYQTPGGEDPDPIVPEEKKVSTLAEAFALESGSEVTVDMPLTVGFVNGRNIFVRDEAGAFIQIYYNNTLKVGDVIPSGWKATYTVRYGAPQFAPAAALPAATEGSFTPAVVPATEVTAALVNHVVTVNNVILAEASPATKDNFTGTVGDVTLNLRNNYTLPSVEAGTYNITLVVNLFNDEPSLYVIKFEKSSTSGIEEIEAADNADAVYYNLNGVRVDNPENGLYIRVSGNKATKVLVK